MSRVIFVGVIFGVVLFSLSCAHEGHHRSHHNHNHSDHQYHGFHHGDHNHSDHQHHGYYHGDHNHSDYQFHGYHRHNHHHHDSDEVALVNDAISSISRLYSNAEASLREFCERNTKITPIILYGQNAYIIKYALPNKDNLNITVKTVNRLIITEVKELGDFKGFQDVRILPEMLDLQNGMWSIEESYLKINLPYKVTSMAEFNAVCPQSYGEVNIPRDLLFNLPKFLVRSNIEQQKGSNDIKH